MQSEERTKKPLSRASISKRSKAMRKKLQGKTFLIPSFITVIGIFCGFLAIISSLKGNFAYASRCIGMAIILDGLDGRVARTLKATSAFGKEFDSLSDLIAFGVAPGVLVYCWCFNSTYDESGILICFLFVVCCATRLARFNITETSLTSFQGLPSPGAAAAIAAVVHYAPTTITTAYPAIVVSIYVILIGSLMVTTLPFFSIKKVKFAKPRNPRILLVGLATAVALSWKFAYEMSVVLSALYAFSGPILFVKEQLEAKSVSQSIE